MSTFFVKNIRTPSKKKASEDELIVFFVVLSKLELAGYNTLFKAYRCFIDRLKSVE
jgi:hypothetical protein